MHHLDKVRRDPSSRYCPDVALPLGTRCARSLCWPRYNLMLVHFFSSVPWPNP